MGRSDPVLHDVYSRFKPAGDIAILGATRDQFWKCDADFFDIQLGNWDINSDRELGKMYDTIICTRCAYFAKDPVAFMQRIHDHLNDHGRFFVDWGLGDHWRFEAFKVGWIRDGEHEYCYGEDNKLWSTFWTDKFLQDSEFKRFVEMVSEIDPRYAIDSIKEQIYDEVPSIITSDDIVSIFGGFNGRTLALWPNAPQFYVFVDGVKR